MRALFLFVPLQNALIFFFQLAFRASTEQANMFDWITYITDVFFLSSVCHCHFPGILLCQFVFLLRIYAIFEDWIAWNIKYVSMFILLNTIKRSKQMSMKTKFKLKQRVFHVFNCELFSFIIFINIRIWGSLVFILSRDLWIRRHSVNSNLIFV